MADNKSLFNDDNVTSPTSIETSLAAISILVLAVWAMTVYLLVLIVIIRHLNYFENSFYSYLVSLGFSDCLALSIFIFYVVPCTSFQTRPFGPIFDQFIGFLSIFSWYSCLAGIICIAINRYWAVCRTETLHDVFSTKNVKVSIICVWLSGFFFAFPTATPLAPFRYNYTSFAWSYDISPGLADLYVYRWEPGFTIFTCIVLVVSYIFILVEVRKQTSQVADSINQFELAQRRKQEIKLALQFLAVGVYLLFFDVVYLSLPAYTSYRWHLYILSLLWIINCSINPFIYLTTSSQIREKVFTSLGFVSSHISQTANTPRPLPGTSNGAAIIRKKTENCRPTMSAAKNKVMRTPHK